jgi:dienelactone hydrolase
MARVAEAVFILLFFLLAGRSAGADTLEARALLDGEEVAVDVHLPDLGQGQAIAVVAHGFIRSRKRHGELGRALAAAGIVAIVPDLPSTANHWANGRAIAELVTTIERGAFGLAAVPRARVVLIGTSAGGFASLLAAAELPGIAGWIGLDPVDRTGSAIAAASRLQAPAVVLRAGASPCNLFGSAHRIADAAPRLRRELRLDGVTHCDFESPTNRLCSVACGGSSAAAAARGGAVAGTCRCSSSVSVGVLRSIILSSGMYSMLLLPFVSTSTLFVLPSTSSMVS